MPAPSEGQAYRRLADILASGGPEVVLEGPFPSRLSSGRVLAMERHAEWLRIEAEAEGEALLVVNDAYWPGWKATIDGRSVAILPADALVRAVTWPAGRHVLEMRYDPGEVRAGLLVTAAGALAWLAAAAVAWRHGSRAILPS